MAIKPDLKPFKKQLSTPGLHGAFCLMSALEWRPLKKGSSPLKLAKAMNKVVTHSVTVSAANEVAVCGLYSSPPADEGRKLPAYAASAAACFAGLVAQEHPAAALALTQASGAVYVVTIADGVPVIDRVCADINDAVETLLGISPVYSNDEVSFPGGYEASWEWLASGATLGKLKPIPLDPRAVLGLGVGALLVVALALGGFVLKKREDRKKAAAAAAAAAAADPAPRYAAALAVALPTMRTSAQKWESLYARMGPMTLTAPGWLRMSITCDALSKECFSEWARKGGTTPELVVALAPAGEKVAQDDTLQAARSAFVFDSSSPPFDASSKLPTYAEWQQVNGPVLQNWLTAGFNPRYSGALALWPAAEGVPAEYRADNTLGRVSFTMTVPGAFVAEILLSSPREISWQKMRLIPNHGGDGAQKLTVQLDGVIYVTLR